MVARTGALFAQNLTAHRLCGQRHRLTALGEDLTARCLGLGNAGGAVLPLAGLYSLLASFTSGACTLPFPKACPPPPTVHP